MTVRVMMPDGSGREVPSGGTLTLGRAPRTVPRKDGSLPAPPLEHVHLGNNPHLSALAVEVRDLGDRYAVRCGENPNSGHLELTVDEHTPFGHTLPFDGELALALPATAVRLCLYDEARTMLELVVESDTVPSTPVPTVPGATVDQTQVRGRTWEQIQDAPNWFLALVALSRPLLPAQGGARPPEYRMSVRLFNRCKQLSATTTYAFNQALADARKRVFLDDDATFGRVAEQAVRLEMVTRDDVVAMESWAASH